MHKDLTFLGLTSKESSVYNSLLELGEVSVKELSHKTKIDRTTIYSVLEVLINKNLVSQHNKGKILHFSAHNPKNLLYDLQSKEQKVKELLPDLLQSYQTGSSQIHIRNYQDDKEILALYESILDMPGLKSYDIICSEQDWMYLNPKYFSHFKKRRAIKGIQTRLIMETSTTAQARKIEAKDSLSEVKLLPPAFSPLNFSGGCYILPDRVIFLAYRKEHSAVEIFSKETKNFMQNIFEFMWKTIA